MKSPMSFGFVLVPTLLAAFSGAADAQLNPDWSVTGNAGTNPTTTFLGTTDNQPLVIRTNFSEATRITPGGNVGIGTPSPSVRTQIEGSNDQGATLAIRRPDNGKFMRLGVGTGGVALDFDPSSFLVIQRNTLGVGGVLAGQELLRVTPDGNVGIGTPSPSVRTQIEGSNDQGATLAIRRPDNGKFMRLGVGTGGVALDFDPSSFLVIQRNTLGVGGVLAGQELLRVTPDGNVGIGTTAPGARLHVVGNLIVTGTKNFVQAHPTDSTKEIVYVALEGGEAGTYIRGTGRLINGKALVKLPEHFRLVTSADGLSVQLTPRGEWLQLYTAQLDTDQLVVQEAQGKSGEFDYLIQGVRKGYEDHQVIQERNKD